MGFARIYLTAVAVILLILSTIAKSAVIGQNKENRLQRKLNVQDAGDKCQVEYEVDFEANTITFQVTVESVGFVGFGISPNGGMAGADMIIAGVYPNGTSYFSVI